MTALFRLLGKPRLEFGARTLDVPLEECLLLFAYLGCQMVGRARQARRPVLARGGATSGAHEPAPAPDRASAYPFTDGFALLAHEALMTGAETTARLADESMTGEARHGTAEPGFDALVASLLS